MYIHAWLSIKENEIIDFVIVKLKKKNDVLEF